VRQQLSQQEIQETGLSVQDPSSSKNDMIEVATVVQQIMTELKEAVSVLVITKMVLNLMKQNGC
jgi:hypothetical protein